MKAVLEILYGWLLTTVSCGALGWLIAGWLNLRLKRLERLLLSFLLGAAGMSGVMFVLCATHLARRGVLQALALVIVAAAAMTPRRRHAGIETGRKVSKPWLFLAGFTIFGAVYFFNALAPEVSPDGMAYHLEVVGAYDHAHGFAHLRPTTFSYLPQGLEMLFLFAYEFGRNSAAAMVHFTFLLTLPWLALCFGDRFGVKEAGAFAALLVFASPIVGIDGVSAYNDVALAASAFGAFYLVQVWRETSQRGALLAAGLLAGFCAATKYTGVAMLAYVVCAAVWRSRRQRGAAIRNALFAGVSGSVVVMPWLIRNWLMTGNPVMPLLAGWFPNPFVSPELEQAMRTMALTGSYGTARLRGLWESVAGGANPGLIGPVFLAAPLGLLALRDPLGRRLLTAAAVLLSAYVVNSDTRFLIPALLFLAFPVGIALRRFPRGVMALAAVHLVLSWYAVVPLYALPQWNIREVPVGAALRRTPEVEFYERRAPSYFVARMVESQTPPGAAVLAMSELPQAYTSRTVLVGFQDSTSYNLLGWIIRASSSPDVDKCRFEFPARNVSGVRLEAEGPGAWRIDEMRFWSGGQEITRGAGWRLRADPNPWDVQLAFDNDPLTFWGPRETVKPGMWMGVRFGTPVRLDAVTTHARKGQSGAVRLLVAGGDGRWLDAGARCQCSSGPAERGLRRMATRELMDHGVGYLTISDEDPLARDFRFNLSAWGMREVAVQDGTRLYEVR